MTQLLPFCGQKVSMTTEQKDTLVSHLEDIAGRREGDIIDTAVYHFVHHGHCTSNRPKKDIVNLLHSLIDKSESTAETQRHKTQTTVADGESPESTLDELIERITCDIIPIRKTRPTESMHEFIVSILTPGAEKLSMVLEDRENIWAQLSETIQEMETEGIDMMLSYLVLYCYNTNKMPKEDIIEKLSDFALQCQRDHNADCSNDYEGSSWEKTAVPLPQDPDAEPPSQARDNRPDSDSDSECSSDSMEMEENELDSMVSANKPEYQNIDNSRGRVVFFSRPSPTKLKG